jgi:hypothetical protein
MAWVNNKTGSNIPQRVKRIVNARQADMCATIDRSVCWGTIDEYDHIVNVKRTGMTRAGLNNPDLLAGLCKPCHKVKTQLEAQAGRNRGKRKPPKHPADA